MPVIYRSMLMDGDRPRTGCTAITLGVRVPPDDNADILVQPDGTVVPDTGGMSVAPSWRTLPIFRISRRLRDKIEGATGRQDVYCWRMGNGPFLAGTLASGLVLKPDSAAHGTVEPEKAMPLHHYQAKLAETRDQWVIDED
jgi:hypothetical protein